MSERHDEFHTPIQADVPDERDRIFPPADLREDRTLRAVEQNLRRLLGREVPDLQEHWVTDYRELADPTWYQRGEECVGFALAAIADYHLRRELAAEGVPLDPAELEERTVSRRMLYEMAQVYDRADYEEGSTLRGALKGWRRTGVAREVAWPYEPGDEHGEKHGRLDLRRVIDAVRRPGGIYLRIDTHDVAAMEAHMKRSLLLDHPLFVSAQTHVGWINLYLPDEHEIVKPQDGKMLNGHAFVIVGFDERGWLVHNSWGQEWGDSGYALLRYEDFAANVADVWFVFPAPYARQIHVDELPLMEAAMRPRGTADDDAAPDADDDRADEPAPEKLAKPKASSKRSAAPATLQEAPPEKPADAVPEDGSAARPATYSRMWRHVVTIADDGGFAPIGTTFGMNFDTLKTMLFLFRQQTADWSRRRLAVFADGGYWSTSAAVDLLAPLRDEMMANEIYPLFLLWETPWFADMQGRLYGDAGIDPDWHPEELAEYWTRVKGAPMGKFLAAANSAPAMWAQMRARADAACAPQGAGGRLAESVAYNLTKNAFDVHLVAHGAGDLLLSRLAPLLPTPIRSCHLWAPATTVDQFHATYGAMLNCGCLERVRISALDDDAERSDTMGPLPGSPLLLVSDVLAVDDIDLDTALEEHDGHLVWTPQPEPVVGLRRFLELDEIVRLEPADRVDVDVVPGATHTGLVADAGVRRETIAAIRAVAPPPPFDPPVAPAAAAAAAGPAAAGPPGPQAVSSNGADDPLTTIVTGDPLSTVSPVGF